MSKLVKVLFIASCLLIARCADAKPALQPALLAGPILPGTLQPLVEAVANLHKGDVLPIFINSGGGSVAEAHRLTIAIDHAVAKGAGISCYVLGEAESAAFWILMHCSARFALPQSRLLFHHIRFPEAKDVSARDAARMQAELQQWDDLYLDDIQRRTTVPRKQLVKWMDEGGEWTSAAMHNAMPGVLTAVMPVYYLLIQEDHT